MNIKTIYFGLLITLQAGTAFSQIPPSPNQLSADGQRTGHWTILLNNQYHETQNIDSTLFYGLVNYEGGKPIGKVRYFFKSSGYKLWEGYPVGFNPLPVIQDGEIREYFENGQLRVIQNFKNGKLNGPTKAFNEKGLLMYEGFLKDDLAEGLWIYYHDTGEKYEERPYVGGKINGEVRKYYTNGVLKRKANQVNGQEDGLVEEYYQNGNRNTIHYLSNGKRHGSWEWFNEQGIREERGEYSNDIPVGDWEVFYGDGVTLANKGKKDTLGYQGPWVYFYETGVKKAEGNFKNDKKTGRWVFYYQNGKLYNTGDTQDDLYEGEWVTYYEDGSLKSKKIWHRDTLNGLQVTYHPGNAVVQMQGNNIRGQKDGTFYYYFPDGKLDGVETLSMGQLEGPAYNYYPNGVLKDTATYKQGKYHGRYRAWYENGQLQTSGEYLNGQLSGEWRWYHVNGQLWSKYLYENGKRNGPFEDYYANGNKKRIGAQKNDNREGWIKYWFENGQLKMEGLCQNDWSEGKWIYYDSLTGKIDHTAMYRNNKLHGKSIFYLPNGKKSSTSYYINGFWEETYSIRDSVYELTDAGKYDLALKATRWMERVIKRDGFMNTKQAALPPMLYSSIAYGQKDYATALKWSEDHIRLIKKYEGDTAVNFFTALNSRANIFTELNKTDEALKLYNSSIRFDSLKNRTKGYWVSVSNYASTLLKQRKREQALQFIESRLNGFKVKTGNSSIWAIEGQYVLARFYSIYLNEPDHELSHFITLYRLVENSGPKDERQQELKRTSAASIGGLYTTKGTHNASIPWFKRAIEMVEQGQKTDFGTYMAWHTKLAYAYQTIALTDSALWVYDKMLGKTGEQKNLFSEDYADAVSGKADIFEDQGKLEEAYQLYSEAKTLLEKTNRAKSATYYNVLISMSDLYMTVSRYPEAGKLREEAVTVMREIYGDSSSVYASALVRLADFYRQDSQYKKSLETIVVARNILEQNKNTTGIDYANCLFYTGMTLGALYDYQQALICNQIALEFHEKNNSGYVMNYSNALWQHHRYYKSLEQYDSAEKYINKAIQVVEKSYGANSRRHLDYKQARAWLFKDQSLYTEATKIFLEVMEGYKSVVSENDFNYLHSVRDVGRCYLDQGEYKKAEPYYRQVLSTLARNGNDKTYEAIEAIFHLAEISNAQGNKPMAAELYKKAADVCREVTGPNHMDYAYYLKELALFYHYYGNEPQKAEQVLTDAVTLLGQSSVGTADALYGKYLVDLGNVKSSRNKNKEAEDLFRTALTIISKDKENKEGYYLEGLKGYAFFLAKMGRYREAEKLHFEILDLTEAKRGKQHAYYSYCLDLISLYYDWGKNQQAIQRAEEMLAFTESELSRTHWMVMHLNNLLGLIYFDEKDFIKSEEYFQYCLEATKLLGAEDATYENNIGNALLAQNKLAEAEARLLRAQELRKKKGEVLSPVSYVHVMDNLAALYQAQGRLAESEKVWLDVLQKAHQYTRDNFYFLSDEEKAQFWESIKEDFEYFNTFAVLRSRQNPAILGSMYNNQLATKAILLSASNKVKNRILGSNDQNMIANYYNWVDARESLAQFYSLSSDELKLKKSVIDSIQVSINNLEKELSISAQDLSNDRGNSSVTWRDVQRTLAPDEAAIEIIRFRHFDRYLRDSVVYAALVLTAETRQNPQLVVLPNGRLLEGRNLRYYKNAVTNKLEDKISYAAYWGPIEPFVAGKSRIYLSLDGVYNQINLNTLLNNQGKYLVDSKNLTIVSNTKDLLFMKRKKIRNTVNSASLFGYPKYFLGKEHIRKKAEEQEREIDFTTLDERDATGINELPGTKLEVEQVKFILRSHQWNAIDFTDENASEKALKSIHYPSVLHIATHGFFVDEQATSATFKLGAATEHANQNPLLRSGILLSGASNFIQNNFRLDDENGILTAYEASNLNLENTDLVVLSACETGKGEVQNGEGVYGLQRAFQTAGAQAIIMSLWKVDDTATQELMTSFYQSWMSGSTKAEAFRTAQLQIKTKYNHPYYWGAFVMMGE